MKPLLLIGGHGSTGRKASRILRDRFPDRPVAIAGRDLAAAGEWAATLGNATALAVDLTRSDLGIADGEGPFSGVVVFSADTHFSALAYAERHAIPYIGVTGGAVETGALFVMALAAAKRCAVVLAPHWFCGAATIPAVHLARSFRSVERIRVGILIDRNGAKSGPATTADFQRIESISQSMLVRRGGNLGWVGKGEGTAFYEGVGGRTLEATPSVSIDAASLAAACGAPDIEVLETWGDSASFLRGDIPTDEIIIDMSGIALNGAPLRVRQEITATREIAPLTANMIAMLVEAAEELVPGVYAPEHILDPAQVVRRLADAGATFGIAVNQAQA